MLPKWTPLAPKMRLDGVLEGILEPTWATLVQGASKTSLGHPETLPDLQNGSETLSKLARKHSQKEES